MVEERWHDFAKEKPSEDMEGRNFIVSNGHYEKIATWYGYWENEPFMGDRLCDEVVRWKFYFTPEEEKANEENCKELFVEESYNGGKYYDKDAVDALLAEKDKEIAELKEKLESVQASMYCDVVDANMEVRRLKRALWITRGAVHKAHRCAMYGLLQAYPLWEGRPAGIEVHKNIYRYEGYERKCRAMADKYGEVKA